MAENNREQKRNLSPSLGRVLALCGKRKTKLLKLEQKLGNKVLNGKASTIEQDTELVNVLRKNSFKNAVMAEQTDIPRSVVTARQRIAESELENRSATNKIFRKVENNCVCQRM